MYNKGKIQFFKTQGPKFVDVKLKDNYREKEIQSTVDGNFVRVHWSGSFSKSGKVKKYIKKLGARIVEIVPVSLSGTDADEQNLKQNSKRLESFLSEAVKELPIDERQPTFELGLEILQEAFRQK